MLDIQILAPDDAFPLSDLQSRWKRLCNEIGLTNSSNTLFADLKKHYTETQRMYHNFSHIYTMLKICDTYISEIKNHRVLQLAIWYHDIIYRAIRKDNELKSAEYAFNVLKNADLSSLEFDQLKQLIISTKAHAVLLDNFDNRLLLDIDLAILAASREAYTHYTHAIRKEYKIYPDFYIKREKEGITTFLERKHIYFTEIFQTEHEADARENLAWEIGILFLNLIMEENPKTTVILSYFTRKCKPKFAIFTLIFTRKIHTFGMDIKISDRKLRKAIKDERKLKREYGKVRAEKIKTRMRELTRASTLEDTRLSHGNYHELIGDRKGQWACDLDQPYRLIFIPQEDPIPTDEHGRYIWIEIMGVEIIEITNYH